MFTFSDQHAWQGNEAVQQILVFPNDRIVAKFESIMKERNEAAGMDKSNVSDSDAGAIYKLRAVKNGNGKYIPIIRCGIDGYQLWEGAIVYEQPKEALSECFKYLKNTIERNLSIQ